MSIEHMAVVLHHSRAKGTAKLVLLGIANHQGDGGAWPKVSTLARYANVTERNAQKAIDSLVGKGEVRVDLQAGGGPDVPDHERTNRYHVLVTCPRWCDHTPQHRDTRSWSGRQRGLWTNPVSKATPGVESDRGWVSLPTPGGVSPPTPKPSVEPSTQQVVSQPQDTRACRECTQTQARCLAIQRSWPPADRHDYQPVNHASR